MDRRSPRISDEEMDKVLRNADFQFKLSELLAQDWFKIGLFLNIKQHKLEAIRNNFVNFSKQETKAIVMLTEWFKHDENPTFEKLKYAISNIPRYDLLKEVEELARGFSTMPSVLLKDAPTTEIRKSMDRRLPRISDEIRKAMDRRSPPISDDICKSMKRLSPKRPILCSSLPPIRNENLEEFNRILVEKVSPDWKRFARNACETDIYSIIDHIDLDNDSDKSKMEALLQKLYRINPTCYKDVIVDSLYALNRIDVVLGVVIDQNFEEISHILVKWLSNDWKAFARWFNINDISTIVETIDQNNNCDSMKMESFLEIIFQRFPLDYKDEIARSLNLLGRFDILYGVVLDESSSLQSDSLQEILVKRVSSDWRKFARQTGLPDIDNFVENIDGDFNNDQSKMAAILTKLMQHCPLNYKDLIEHSLNMTNRFDVLLELQFDRHSESFNKILLERLSSDWKNLAQRTCLFEVDYIIEHIDHDFEDDGLKLTEFLRKLFEIDPVNYKQIIKNTLAKLKRFSVLQRLESEGGFSTMPSVLPKDAPTTVEMDWFQHNLKFRMKLSELIDQDWFEIRIYLNVELDILERIKNDFIKFRRQENKAFEMLSEWFKRDKSPTFEKLKYAISNIPRYDILKKVEELARGFSTMPSVLLKDAPTTDP